MNTSQPKTDIVNTLVQTVKQDVGLLEKSGQWVFSSYSPAKECASIPGIGLDDISPEEMRFEAYTAKNNNAFPAFQQTMQNLVQTYANIRRQLLNPTPSLKEALRKIYKDDSNSAQNKSVFGGSSFGQPSQSSSGLFGATNTANNSGANIFGGSSFGSNQASSSKSIFGGGSNMNQNSSNIFGGAGSATQQTNNSIFGGGSQQQSQPGGSSIFGSPSSATSSNPFASFQQKPQQTPSIFTSSQPTQQQGNLFNSVQPTPQANSVFNQPTGIQQPSGGIFSSNTSTTPSSGIFSTNSTAFAGSSEAEGMNEEAIQETPSVEATQSVPGSNTNVQQNTPAPNLNIFQTPNQMTTSTTEVKTGLFGQVIRKAEDPSLYSKVEDLTPTEIEIFKTRKFTLGFIPEIPPPRELCI